MRLSRKTLLAYGLGLVTASAAASLFALLLTSDSFTSTPASQTDLADGDGPQEDVIAHGLEGVQESGELVVLTVASPTTYRERAGIATGYEVDLASEVAQSLGVRVRFVILDDFESVLTAIRNGEGHIAAPGLTQREIELESTEGKEILFGPAYKNVRSVTVCRRNTDMPSSVDEIGDYDVLTIRDSGPDATLEAFVDDVDGLDWEPVAGLTGYGLLGEVAEGEIDCAVVDSNIAQFARRQYPSLTNAHYIGSEDRQLAWEIAPQSRDLLPYLNDWFETAHQAGLLNEIDERYYGHLDEFDYVDIAAFRRRIDSRLPTYEGLFREAAREEDLDWTMLAAQGYQESHWDPAARSPTGVRGIMMLTRPTAREVGVSDRLDPAQSISGGAEYLRRVYERLPDGVRGYDRLWMAMAAYNVGYGHLLDARTLARRRGLSPDKWSSISLMLPLLTEREYYSTLRHGYARGYEPVRYVRRIREYDEVLTSNVEDPERPPFRLDDTGVPVEPPEPETPLPAEQMEEAEEG